MLFKGNWFAPGLQLLNVTAGVGRVLPSISADRRERAWAEAEVIISAPVGEVVQALAARLGIVGNFVLLVPGIRKNAHSQLVEFGILLCVLPQFASLKPPKEFRVLFVRQAIRRNMFRIEPDRLQQALLPTRQSLPRDSKNQVEVQIGKSRAAQNLERLLGLPGRMYSPKALEHCRIPGLHSHADPVHAVVP